MCTTHSFHCTVPSVTFTSHAHVTPLWGTLSSLSPRRLYCSTAATTKCSRLDLLSVRDVDEMTTSAPGLRRRTCCCCCSELDEREDDKTTTRSVPIFCVRVRAAAAEHTKRVISRLYTEPSETHHLAAPFDHRSWAKVGGRIGAPAVSFRCTGSGCDGTNTTGEVALCACGH